MLDCIVVYIESYDQYKKCRSRVWDIHGARYISLAGTLRVDDASTTRNVVNLVELVVSDPEIMMMLGFYQPLCISSLAVVNSIIMFEVITILDNDTSTDYNTSSDEELVIMGDISFPDSDDDDDTESDDDTNTSTDEYTTFRGRDLEWHFPKLTEQDIEQIYDQQIKDMHEKLREEETKPQSASTSRVSKVKGKEKLKVESSKSC
ncbi:hypothetical protein Tco_0551096 [Tanacetum coccineum]